MEKPTETPLNKSEFFSSLVEEEPTPLKITTETKEILGDTGDTNTLLITDQFGKVSELSKERMKNFENLFDDLIIHGAASKVRTLVTDIRFEAKSKTLLLPKSLKSVKNQFFVVLIGICLKYNIRILWFESKDYDGEILKALDDDGKSMLTGIAIGAVESRTNLTFDSIKNSQELGRRIAFALRVRGYFRRHPSLGVQALKVNRLFFGNGKPTEGSRKTKIAMLYKDTLPSIFTKAEQTEKAYSVLAQILDYVNLTNCAPKFITDVVEKNIKSLQSLIDDQRRQPKGRTRPNKQSDIKKEKGKLPEIPAISPLFTKAEMELIKDRLKPVWTRLQFNSRNYLESVYKLGYTAVSQEIRGDFNVRWTILERFAQLTTKRLTDVKASKGLAPGVKLAKSSVSRDDLMTMLSIRTNRIGTFATEVVQLITLERSQYYESLAKYFSERVPSNLTLIDTIAIQIRDRNIYKEVETYSEELSSETEPKDSKSDESTKSPSDSLKSKRKTRKIVSTFIRNDDTKELIKLSQIQANSILSSVTKNKPKRLTFAKDVLFKPPGTDDEIHLAGKVFSDFVEIIRSINIDLKEIMVIPEKV